jgi:CopG family nickel-responsive transcriptional regulator
MGKKPAPSPLARIGVAIEQKLLDKFDSLLERRKYENRSEAFRDLIRAALIEDRVVEEDRQVVGSLTLLYDHEKRMLSEKLTGMQHHHHDVVISSMHVHLDHHNCMELIVLRGTSAAVRRLADGLISAKGVLFGKLTLAEPPA